MSTAHMTCIDCGEPAVLRVDPYYRRHELLCRVCATPPLRAPRLIADAAASLETTQHLLTEARKETPFMGAHHARALSLLAQLRYELRLATREQLEHEQRFGNEPLHTFSTADFPSPSAPSCFNIPPVRSVPSQQQSHEDADRPFQTTTPRPKQDP